MRTALHKFAGIVALLMGVLYAAPLAHAAWPKPGDVLVLTASFDGSHRHEYLFAVDAATKTRTFIVDFSAFSDPELGPFHASPVQVAAAPDGSIWAIYHNVGLSTSAGVVVKVNPDLSHQVMTVFGPSIFLSGIAIGADGAVYVVSNGSTLAGLFRIDASTGAPIPVVLNTAAVDPDCKTTVCPPIQFRDASGLAVDAAGDLLLGDMEGGVLLSAATLCQQLTDCGALYRIHLGAPFVMNNPSSQYNGQMVVAATKTVISDFDNPAKGPIGNDAGGAVALVTDGTFLITDSSRWFSYGQPSDPCLGNTFPSECYVLGTLFRVYTDGTRTALSVFGDQTQGQTGGVSSIISPLAVAVIPDGTILIGDCDGVTVSRAICSVDPTTGFRTLWSDFGVHESIGSIDVQLLGVDALAIVPGFQSAATTTLTSSLNPSTYGESVTFTANVTSNTATAPTGSVTFADGGTTLATVTLAAGIATFTTSALNGGTHPITATYSGDSNFPTSSSTPVSQVVNRAATSTTITSSVNPASSGAPITFTASVTPASGSGPTGTVTFYDGATSIGATTLATGTASVTLNALANGNHSITATYNGDTNFNASTSATLNEAVGAMTDLAITLAAAPPSVTRTTNTTLNVVVTNNGPLNATSVVARLALPAGLAFVSANPAASYAPATGLWTIGDLASGASVTLQVVATLNATSVSVAASIVSADQADGNLANNSVAITINEAAINVGGACDLRNAIIAANTDAPSGGCPAGLPGLDVIYLPPNSTIEYADVFETPAGIGADELPAVTSPIIVEGRSSVVGPSAAAGTPSMRVFYVAKGGALTLHNLMVRNGTGAGAGGGVLLQGAGASVVVDASQIVGNFANFGGGIASGIAGSGDHGDIVIRNSSLIAANTAYFGGGVFAAAALIITNSTVGSGNVAGANYTGNLAFSDGGGVYTVGNTTIGNSFIHDNTADTKGGGIVNDGTATIDTSQIYNNKSTTAGAGSGLGAGLLTGRFGTTAVTNSRIFTNTGIDGGGVWNSHVTTLTDTEIFENKAQVGGGIENAGLLNLVRGSINQNAGDQGGGGIANLIINDLGATAALNVDSTSITNNTTKQFGGGIASSGPATLTNVTISGNHSDFLIGGIAAYAGSMLTLSGGTVRANSAASSEGGIYVYSGATADIRNSIIAANTSGAAGGGLGVGGTVTLTDTTIGGPAIADGNVAADTGGGISIISPGSLVMAGGTIQNNVANGPMSSGGGGGLANGSATFFAGSATLNNVLVTNNRAPNAAGGGVYVGSQNGFASLTLNGGTITANTAAVGGGFSVGNTILNGASIAVFGTAFSNNTATTGPGGGIFVGGRLYMVGGSVTANHASTNGGGIYGRYGSIDITDVVIDGNTAATSGGGMFTFSPNVNIRGGAIRNNTAVDGGGLYSDTFSMVIDSGTIIESNTATHSGATLGGGGGLFLANGTTISNAVIRNNTASQASGGGVLNLAVLRIDDSSISGNNAVGGAGLSNGDPIVGSPTVSAVLNNVALGSNTASGVGGAIASTGSLNVNGGTVSQNKAAAGGGISAGGQLVLTGTVIDANSAGLGGNLFTVGSVSITGGTISNGTATTQGGNVWTTNGPTIIDGVMIRGGVAPNGGGIYLNSFSSLTIQNGTVLESNVAGDVSKGGGGLFVDRRSNVTVSGSTIRNNYATHGAAISFFASNGTISATTISGNQTSTIGTIFLEADQSVAPVVTAAVQIDHSAIVNNYAFHGGVMELFPNTSAAITDSTISGNSSDVAILYLTSQTSVQISSSTVVNNSVSAGSAAVSNPGGGVTVDNSIIAGNRLAAGGFADCLTPVVSNGHNLFGAGGGCGLGASDRTTDPNTVFTAVLAPLANNGGPTFTHALLPGSPALDSGAPVGAGIPPACLPTDQRGLPRPKDGTGFGARCDIGAFEQQTLLIPPPRLDLLNPYGTSARGISFNLTAVGVGFVPGSVLNWNGAPLMTTVADPSHLSATVPAADDVIVSGDFSTVLITVTNPDGTSSNPQVFTLYTANILGAYSQLVPPGSSLDYGLIPAGPGLVGIAGTYSNNTAGSSPAIVTVADYKNNPVGGTVFDIGGKFADLRVSGADPTDSMTANFYYPTNVAGPAEASLQLTYWNGAAWAPVLSSGGVAPVKDTTDNLDGTTSGGRFSVVFDNTSTPKITDLKGTVFMIAPREAALDFDPKTRDLAVLDRFGEAASVTVSPTTWGDDDAPSSEDSTSAELRAYVLGSDASTSVTMIVKVKQAGHEIKARVISVQYGSDLAVTEPENLLSVEWADSPAGSIKELEQKVTIGTGADRQEIKANFDVAKNRTTIDDNTHSGHVVEPGLVLLRMVTNGNTIMADFPR